MLPDFDIAGQTVLITGAGRGIGKAIALVFAEAGADVAVTALTEANAKAVAKEIRELGRKGLGLAADATSLTDTRLLAKTVLGEFGHLDVLINCVGDSIRGTVAQMPDTKVKTMGEDDWHHILDVNLTQAYTGCHVFGPQFFERREGCVINISSSGGLRARANAAAYAAAKAGLIRFTESLALEWAPYGIRVNGIAPGSFPDLERTSGAELSAQEQWAERRVPLGRLGRLREVGLLALFLASDAAAYITGQTVAIDGGQTAA